MAVYRLKPHSWRGRHPRLTGKQERNPEASGQGIPKGIRSEIEESNVLEHVPPEHLMIGFMYNLTDRCPHRFTRADT